MQSGTLSILFTAIPSTPGSQEAQKKSLLNASMNSSEEKLKKHEAENIQTLSLLDSSHKEQK